MPVSVRQIGSENGKIKAFRKAGQEAAPKCRLAVFPAEPLVHAIGLGKIGEKGHSKGGRSDWEVGLPQSFDSGLREGNLSISRLATGSGPVQA